MQEVKMEITPCFKGRLGEDRARMASWGLRLPSTLVRS